MLRSLLLLFLIALISSANTVSAQQPQAYGSFNIDQAVDQLPASSDKPFVDRRLLDNGEIGIRVFRVYNPVPRHKHAYSSTYLRIESGKAIFRVADGEPFEAGSGDMVFWQRGVFHEVIEILQHPLVFLAIDAPTRREGDAQR